MRKHSVRCLTEKRKKYSNTDFAIDCHGNNQSFEACGSALVAFTTCIMFYQLHHNVLLKKLAIILLLQKCLTCLSIAYLSLCDKEWVMA